MIAGKRVLGWIVALALAASCAPVHATSDIPEEEAAETVTAQMVLGGEGGEPAAEEPETEETPEAAIAEESAEAPEEALEDVTLEPETPAEKPTDAEAAEPAPIAVPEAAQTPSEPPEEATEPEPEDDEYRETLRLTIAYAATGGRADEAGAPTFTVKADGEMLARFNLKDGEQTTVEVPHEAEAPLETADEPESEVTEEAAADEPETETVTASAFMASAAGGATVTVTIDAESSVTDWTLDGEAIGTEGSRVTFLLTNGATLAATTDYPEIALTGARTAPVQPFVLLLGMGIALLCGAMLRKRIWEGGEADA